MIHRDTPAPTPPTAAQTDKTHAASSSIGSSVSFHTVTSSFGASACGSGCASTLWMRRSEEATFEELVPEEREDEDEGVVGRRVCTVSTRVERTVERVELDRAQPASGVQAVAEEVGDGGLLVDRDLDAEQVPSPSVTSRTFDAHTSPPSRPLTMLSFASIDDPPPHASVPARQRKQAMRTLTASTTADEDNSTASSASSTSSHPTSHTSTIPPPSRRLARTRKSSPAASTTRAARRRAPSANAYDTMPKHIAASVVAGATTEWGANFWCVVTDPFAPANTFFANPTTGECRWVLPAGTMVLPPSADGEWWELVDEAGREYYYHTRTGESRWTRPTRGMVIPMAAVQRAGHVAEKPALREEQREWGWGNAWEGEREWLLGGAEEREQERWTTPLRPRTRSLPKPHAANRAKHVHRHAAEQTLTAAPRPSNPRPRHAQTKEDLAQRARTSILLRDQKALEHARRTCGPPFRPDPHSHSRPRKITSTPLRTPRTLSKPEAAASPAITIQRLGKGLAFNPATPCSSTFAHSPVRERRSMSFLGRRSSVRGKTGLPVELTAMLLDAPMAVARGEVQRGGGREGVGKDGEKGRDVCAEVKGEERRKRKFKLAKLIHYLAPCRRSAVEASSLSDL
ncbi:uncharacterized protein SRS1_16223 [Sporisorium reilianum f. sp. reilianum]|uniref:WW domain-containing protein n=1 Tax=Sporisorium reilianum f. sp. reilianum TaxID=72559 RepID=A0A2N8UL02_9BASI|nr:uncharacterized protein SRS1_16223 [Sporisorium reilianum f. sp. reilianum]